jgi:predicted double-glycine peptidase
MKPGLPVCLAATLFLGACMSPPQSAALRRQTPPEFPAPVLLEQIPFFPQEAYQCGPAALATVLVASNLAVTPGQLLALVYVPERKGSFQFELLAAARSHGRIAYLVDPTMTALFSEVRAGHPVLVMQNLGVAWYPRWHYAVLKGFDPDREEVLLNTGIYENYRMSFATFERTWARSNHWAMLALEPGTLPVTANPSSYFSALVALEETNPAASLAAAYRGGLQAWPADRNLLMGYGNLLYAQAQPEAAAAQFGLVTEQYPDYAPAWNNLAQILFEQGEREQALFHARQAVALGGDLLATYRATLRMISPDAL